MKSLKNEGGVITRLSQGKRDPTRVNVYLDNRFAFALSAERVITQGLAKGQTLTSEQVEGLTKESDEEKLFAKIVNFISFRPRSEKEVVERLYQYSGREQKELKEQLVSRLKKLGYINDTEFARWFAQSRTANRPRSTRHLASELYAKGVGKEIITQVLEEFADDRAAIRALIAKKTHLEKDKLIAFLARRGFSWEVIKEELASPQGGLDK